MSTSFLLWKHSLLLFLHCLGEVCRRLTSEVFTFSEPCIAMQVRGKDQQEAHLLSVIYFTFVPCSILILSKFHLSTN